MSIKNNIRAFFLSRSGKGTSTARPKDPGAITQPREVEIESLESLPALFSTLKHGEAFHYTYTEYFGSWKGSKQGVKC